MLELPFVVPVLPRSFEALEAGALVEFLKFVLHEILGDKLDFARSVALSSLGAPENVQETPVEIVDSVLEISSEARLPAVWMGGVDEIVDQAKKVGTVSGAHELLSRLRLGSPVVVRHAAVRVAHPCLAGAEGFFTFPRDFT
jgi:hypothetical protein